MKEFAIFENGSYVENDRSDFLASAIGYLYAGENWNSRHYYFTSKSNHFRFEFFNPHVDKFHLLVTCDGVTIVNMESDNKTIFALILLLTGFPIYQISFFSTGFNPNLK